VSADFFLRLFLVEVVELSAGAAAWSPAAAVSAVDFFFFFFLVVVSELDWSVLLACAEAMGGSAASVISKHIAASQAILILVDSFVMFFLGESFGEPAMYVGVGAFALCAQFSLSRGHVAALRKDWPDLRFTFCSDDDMPARLPAALKRDKFNLYLVSGGEHCLSLTDDPLQAIGVVLAGVDED